jgi:FKBP-type peptidyl-prolyl cis-trans isomerase
MLFAVLVLLLALTPQVTAQEPQVTSDRRKDKKCNGPTAKVGDSLIVHYEGFFHDAADPVGVKGKMFDSSVKRCFPSSI